MLPVRKLPLSMLLYSIVFFSSAANAASYEPFIFTKENKRIFTQDLPTYHYNLSGCGLVFADVLEDKRIVKGTLYFRYEPPVGPLPKLYNEVYFHHVNIEVGMFANGKMQTFPKEKYKIFPKSSSVAIAPTNASPNVVSMAAGGFLVSYEDNEGKTRNVEVAPFPSETTQYFSTCVANIKRDIVRSWSAIHGNPACLFSPGAPECNP